jgi:hypothetical protein
LYVLPILQPTLLVDDFQIAFRSWTWQRAWENLWVPANEHAMPLGRITTAALVSLAGGHPTSFVTLSAWQGPLALIFGMILTGVFVGRERGHAFFGLLAMVLFGVSTVHRQGIYWFSASFSVLALDTFLLGLLAAQRAVRTGGRWSLIVCVLACALAPGWFAIGVLAGPFCCVYLFLAASEAPEPSENGRAGFRRPRAAHVLRALTPLLGTAAFLAVSLPLTAQTILHLPHYGDETAIQAFHPVAGFVIACRSTVDNLAWSFLGVSEVMCPPPWFWIPFALLVALAAWWAWRAPRKTIVLLGVCMVAVSYWLMYSARVNWSYELYSLNWNRYHLIPQLGLAFIVTGGLPSLRRWAGENSRPGLSGQQTLVMVILLGGLFLTQLPRGLLTHLTIRQPREFEDKKYVCPLTLRWELYLSRLDVCDEQRTAMRRIEHVDALCRQHHIDAATARRVLPEIHMSGDCSKEPQNESNWQFLRGSDDPREISDENARRLLLPALED